MSVKKKDENGIKGKHNSLINLASYLPLYSYNNAVSEKAGRIGFGAMGGMKSSEFYKKWSLSGWVRK